jgi:hypothetical protein
MRAIPGLLTRAGDGAASGTTAELRSWAARVPLCCPANVAGWPGDATYRRLAEVKAKYDPENVFHNNKNIQPSTPAR